MIIQDEIQDEQQGPGTHGSMVDDSKSTVPG